MARYAAQVKSTAALAVDTGFAWLMASANNGFKLRRATIGVITATAVVPTSQQCTFGINRVSTAGTTPTAGMTPAKLDPSTAAAGSVWNTAYSTPPTLASADMYAASFNSQSGMDLPWELLEEMSCLAGTSSGLAFINRDLALPSGHSYRLSVEWEE